MTSARFGNTPSCRTSPSRPPSATATAIVALWTSIPTNTMLRIRSAPHAGGSAPANPAQPSQGACSGAGRPSQAANIGSNLGDGQHFQTDPDGSAAHVRCCEQAAVGRILAAAQRSVRPKLALDPGEVTLRSE